MSFKKLQGKLRKQILGLHNKAHSGHIGCSLSCIDLLISILHDRKEGDRFILSKGHAASALYTILHELGDISDAAYATFYENGTQLPAHPAPRTFASIPFATGSLGHGLPLATGTAKGFKLLNQSHISYVLMSDGETNEGTTWEAAHFAVSHKLDNLIVFVDKNGLQGFGETSDVLGNTADIGLWEKIGFEAVEVDGHDIASIVAAKHALMTHKDGRPKVIVARTVKGKGVSYMENQLAWHYLPMTETQYMDAMAEIEQRYFGEEDSNK